MAAALVAPGNSSGEIVSNDLRIYTKGANAQRDAVPLHEAHGLGVNMTQGSHCSQPLFAVSDQPLHGDFRPKDVHRSSRVLQCGGHSLATPAVPSDVSRPFKQC